MQTGILIGEPSRIRIDDKVDFNWGPDAPIRGMPRDSFSVRWKGWLKAPKPGTYKLMVASDDGVWLRLDRKLLIDQWKDAEGNERYSVDVKLTDQPHELEIAYYEHKGVAAIALGWAQDGVFAEQLVPKEALFHDFAAAKEVAVVLPQKPDPLPEWASKKKEVILQNR